jgi:hypothetical protein
VESEEGVDLVLLLRYQSRKDIVSMPHFSYYLMALFPWHEKEKRKSAQVCGWSANIMPVDQPSFSLGALPER